jgi:glycosyltransferase involved in cell wall biosynthesis
MVTIVIPCFNHADYLGEAIESALNQSIECEIIVVDDGSTDNTAEVCKQYPVKYIYQENKGLPASRNTGIEAATQNYIICLDADDKLEPTAAEKCLKLVKINTGFVRTGLKHFGDLDVELTPSPYISKEDWLVNNQAYCTALFPKKVWEKVGGWDESMTDGYEDWDFWARIVWSGYDVETVHEPLLLYRKHGHSMVEDSKKKHEELASYIRNKYEILCGNTIIR